MKTCSLLLTFVFFLFVHAAEATQTYVVKKGDSLYKIAKKFKVDQQKIREENDLDSIKLKPGTRLTIPSREATVKKDGPHHTKSTAAIHEKTNSAASARALTPEASPAAQEPLYHTVRRGDTLASIAREYSMPIKDLKEMNHIRKATKLKTGQQLLVKRTGPRSYTVKKGDNIWKIAKRFNVSAEELQELNELESEDLKPGQRLILEALPEQHEPVNYPILSETRLSEDIKVLAQSPELDALGMKERLILFARRMLNIPYRFGGSTFMGIDCSGYVQKVFGFLDVPLPRTAREQFHFGEPVSKEELSIGDLVFFRTYATFPSHVGIYLGNNLFIHASSRSRKVSIDSLDTPYYIKRFIGGKRLFLDEVDAQVEQKEKG